MLWDIARWMMAAPLGLLAIRAAVFNSCVLWRQGIRREHSPSAIPCAGFFFGLPFLLLCPWGALGMLVSLATAAVDALFMLLVIVEAFWE